MQSCMDFKPFFSFKIESELITAFLPFLFAGCRFCDDTMSTSVLLACDLNEPKLPQFVLIREQSGADASFFIVSLIGSCLKHQQNGVVLVCLHHIGQHYISAAARLGVNIGAARDKDRIAFIEPLADIGQNFLASPYVCEPEGKVFDSLFQSVKENAERQLATKQHVTIVIDNVVMLIDLGYTVHAVRRLCHRLIDIGNDRISLVLKINTSNLYMNLIRSIEDYAAADYHVAKMNSGEFHEVDGKIIYKKRCDSLEKHTIKTILYKVSDKNIRIFQPGEIGVRS